ncbi:integrase [Streptomyces sp. NPDC020412]|uniref:integrase n=1 Tax=Streptomyces sp. NPDC020412 TaxID=3365073 RepID=UPI0037A44182
MVVFAAAADARIGEVSRVCVTDIDTSNWIWTVRRQTTPAPGGLTDKNTKVPGLREGPLGDLLGLEDCLQQRLN